MESIFRAIWRLAPAALVLKAIVAAIIADVLLLGFILLRRAYRNRYFTRRDARLFEIRQNWDALISGLIPYEAWRNHPFDRRIIEEITLDAFEAAGPKESLELLRFLRASGLIEKRIFEARQHRGWRRRRALVALGRTRAPEGIPAMAEGLRDQDVETRLAALRGLGKAACPEAGEEILSWLGEAGLVVPALPLQSALIQCCRERPQMLMPILRQATGPLREVLGRVLGEVATPSLGMDLLEFAEDSLDELRAATARALSPAKPGLALEALGQLALDRVWFVRLRAIVSLGKLCRKDAIPFLLHGLTDSNRIVRLRAAEGLVEFKTSMAQVFERVVEVGDRYGLHAYLTAVENAGLRSKLEMELQSMQRAGNQEKIDLLQVLGEGTLPAAEPASQETMATGAASRK